MSYLRMHYPWRRIAPPPGLDIWPQQLGQIDADRPDRHQTMMDHHVLHIILRGTGTISSSHADHALCPGDLFCLWPGITCLYEAGMPDYWAFVWLHLSGPGVRRYVAALGFTPERLWLRPSQPDAAIRIANQLLNTYRTPTEEHVPEVASHLLRLVAECGSAPHAADPPGDLVADALSLLRASLHTGINISEVCTTLGINRTTLERAFRLRLGEPPVKVLNRLRLERATAILQQTDLTTDEVAAMVGFGSGKYLMRRLQQDLHTTTTALRQQR